MDGIHIVPAAGENHLAGLNLSAVSTAISSESSITAITGSAGQGSARENLLNLLNALPVGLGNEELLRLIIPLLVLERLGGEGPGRSRQAGLQSGQFSFLHLQQSTHIHSEQIAVQMATASYSAGQVNAITGASAAAGAERAVDATG